MSHITTSRLVNFSARLDQKLENAGVVNFARPNQEEPSTMSKVAKGAAVGAGLAGAAAGGLYLRGRRGIAPGTLGVKDTILRGKNLVIGQDLPNAGRAAKAGIVGGMAAAKKASQRAYAATSGAAMSAASKIKARMGK